MTEAIEPKRIFILGATGGVGRALIDQGLALGHSVTAFVRSPEKLGAPRERLTVIAGDARDTGALRGALPGHEAVISAIGPPGLGPTTLHRDAAESTATAMKVTGVRRLLMVSAAVLFQNEGFVVWFARNTFLRNIHDDCVAMERIVTASDLDWTLVRPPRLTNGPLTGSYSVAADRLPRGGRAVSRADVAQFLLQELERSTYVRRIVGMASRGGAPSKKK